MTGNTLNPQISEEAAGWLVEFRTGELEPAQLQQFDAWVRTSPEHLRAYLEMAAIWNEGDGLDAGQQLSSARLLVAIQSEENVVPIAAGVRTPPARRRSEDGPGTRRRYLAAAAVGGVLIAVGLVATLTLGRAPAYATDAGEQRTLALADGSVVTLNSRSRIRVRMSAHQREIDLLEGQALFKVAKDPDRPFIVGSDRTYVRAVGTQFDVYRKDSGIVVTVIEGKVVVSGAASEVKDAPERAENASSPGAKATGGTPLVAGEQVTVTDAGPGSAVLAELPVVTAWTQRQLIFQSTTLAEVAEEFNRYSTRKLLVEERAATPLRLSGVFSIDPQFMIGYLRSRPHVSVIERGDQVRIVHDDG
ncbi:FecR family protein [Peristeroidobacter soli]|jgi:transmembrane sensor|uniref:FecR family protein n=1 Tax=Peristeroidobacter soli TaxID=2497877 RepID=UPI00101BEA3C|nr:FecR domain-containing protein [Peristeroidobacter soli]